MSVLCSDCRTVLQDMPSKSIDMIYLDPPFFTQKVHTQKSKENGVEYSFVDCWDSIDSYVIYMQERLSECHRVLKDSGNIFLHCDKNASQHLRLILDGIFGANNFQNEIIWSYKRWTSSKSALQSQHQTIYFYRKSKNSKFNTLFTNYSASTNVDQILQKREKNSNGKSIYKTNQNGDIVWVKDKKGVPLGDVWEIPYLNPKANERTGYPTQKPILLLERIIEISTDIGDTVLDPFCGSGTTLVASKLLNRQYTGIDISADACRIARKRIDNPIKTFSNLLAKGANSYITKTSMESNILASLEAVPVQRNSGIDGLVNTHQGGQIIPVKIQSTDETLYEARDKLIRAAQKKNFQCMILVRTHNNHGQTSLNPITENGTLLIIDSLELSVGNWFAGLENLAHQIVV